MKEYPSTQKIINLNNNTYIIKMLTLRIQCKLEDENIEVTYLDIISECTNIPDNILEFIPQDQLDVICEDIISFSSSPNNNGTPQTAISLVAWLMNHGHIDAQNYRVDFVRHIVNEMNNEAERMSGV